MKGSSPGTFRYFAAAALFASLALCMVGLHVLAGGEWSPVSRLVGLVILAQLPYAGLLLLLRRAAPRRPLLMVLAAAAVLRLILVSAPPVFSDDVYRYVWDGRVAQAGIDPYAHPPDEQALEPLRTADWDRINNKDLRTPYPPVAQLLFRAAAAVSPTVTGFKAMTAAADLVSVCLVFLLASLRRRQRRESIEPCAVLAAAAYGLNPFVCVETAMSGHLEPLAVAPILAALLVLESQSTWIRRFSAGVFLSVAAGMKLYPLLLLPHFARFSRPLLLLVPVLCLGIFGASVLTSGTRVFESADAMARRWEGNGSLFEGAKLLGRQVATTAGGTASDDGTVYIPFLDEPARLLEGTFFSLHKDGRMDPARPGAFPIADISLAVAKLLSGAALLAVIISVVLLEKKDPVRGALVVLGAFLLLSPVVHPWYVIPILAPAAVRGSVPWFFLAGALPLAYLPLDGWWENGVWSAPVWIQVVEYALPVCAFAAVSIAMPRWRKRQK